MDFPILPVYFLHQGTYTLEKPITADIMLNEPFIDVRVSLFPKAIGNRTMMEWNPGAILHPVPAATTQRPKILCWLLTTDAARAALAIISCPSISSAGLTAV